ncbi:putative 50 kDa protein in type I retrotransposable element R1DM [Lucilia cuprina]|nr:putative 50 kDa protein in type I retrotransposable element R1DM [Lucilia cuprina]
MCVTSKEVVEKVVKEVGPTLGVRMYELRPLRRSDGAVIRTSTVAEKEKVAANEKFGEVGLEVKVNDQLGPRVMVQRIHPEITPDEFMYHWTPLELYDLNYRRRMTPEEFKRSVSHQIKDQRLELSHFLQNLRRKPAVASRSASASRRVPVIPATTAAVAPTANLPKPVETWSAVVKGKKGVTLKEVVKEVGPTLGVRMHELRPLRRSDGAVIRTPSIAEREKVAANEKFGEVGLEMLVNDKLGPKVVVQRVHPEITPDDLRGEVYNLNYSLVSLCSLEVCRRAVKCHSRGQ